MFHGHFRRKYSQAATEAIQDLLDELDESRQSRCALGTFSRDSVWFFQRMETLRSHHRRRRAFDAEAKILENALTKSFRIRNEAIKNLCSSVRPFRGATLKEECKGDYPHALQALWEALDRAEDLIQN
jgi:hypothetical protein